MNYDPVRDHSGTCRKCGAVDKINRHPGRFPYCYGCGAIQLWMGKTHPAPCVDGGGSAYSHMQYVSDFGPDEKMVCAFCGRSSDELLPEWPEIDEKELVITRYNVHRPEGRFAGVRILHNGARLSVSCDSEKSLLKNKALALKALREQLKPIGIGAYNPEE
jgi:hypothetical protein